MTLSFAVFYSTPTILKGKAVHFCNVSKLRIPQYRSNTCAAYSYSAPMDSRWYGPQPAWRKASRLDRRVIPGCDDRTGRIQRCTRLDVCFQATSVSGTYLPAATGTTAPQRTSYLAMQPLWRRELHCLKHAGKTISCSLSGKQYYLDPFTMNEYFNFLSELFLRLRYGSCSNVNST